MSILIANGMCTEDIGDLMGYNDTSVTDPVGHHEIRPTLITAQAKASMVGRIDLQHPLPDANKCSLSSLTRTV
jgi:hypothetical protein